MTLPEIAGELRSLAQNDYMIDGHFLPTGKWLMDAAWRLEQEENDTRDRITPVPDQSTA
jgi:hypothetical protein